MHDLGSTFKINITPKKEEYIRIDSLSPLTNHTEHRFISHLLKPACMRSFSYVIGITIFSICFFSCVSSGLDEAKQVADLASETSGRHSSGSIPTSDSHYYMKAKIDGKQWIASHMLPDQDENSSYIIIHGENGEDYMDFQLWKRGIDPGKKKKSYLIATT